MQFAISYAGVHKPKFIILHSNEWIHTILPPLISNQANNVTNVIHWNFDLMTQYQIVINTRIFTIIQEFSGITFDIIVDLLIDY